MRKLAFILFTITTVFALTSCGSDDKKEQVFFNGDCKQSVVLESGPANSSITTNEVSATLDDMLKGATGYGSPVSTGEFHVNGANTVVKITGLPDNTVLKNFSLEINGLKNDFGDIPVTHTNLYTGNSTYFQKVFDKMIKDKKLSTKATFTPTEKTSSDVKLEIVLSGRFSYWAKK